MYAKQGHPPLCTVCGVTGKQHPYEGGDGEHDEEDGGDLEIFAVDVLNHHHRHHAKQENAAVLDDGSPVVGLVEGERAAGAEHLDEANDTKEEKDHPYDLVALEDVAEGESHRLTCF